MPRRANGYAPSEKLFVFSAMAEKLLKDEDIKDYICKHARNINEQDDIIKGIKFVSRMMRMLNPEPVKNREEYC